METNQSTKSFTNREEHLAHQETVFQALAPVFASGDTITTEILPVYHALARRLLRTAQTVASRSCSNNDATTTTTAATAYRILDVACGAGALWPFLRDAASDNDVLAVVGVDLCHDMVAAANAQGKQLATSKNTFTAVQSDIEAYCQVLASSPSDAEKKTTDQELFHVAVLNACFGNFYDPPAVLHALCSAVTTNGALVITHPLAASFVAELHAADPATVPHLLPESRDAWQWMIAKHNLPLRLLLEEEEKDDDDDDDDDESYNYYFTALQRTRARTLPDIVRLQGIVDQGYGRGGKKLGFPTANLPSGLFAGALESVATGVYWGWASVGGADDDNTTIYKAVVNVGYSPTFQGQENPEKIVEAHVMVAADEPPLPDEFYGEPMRLLLLGFLRPEQKFPSFPELVAQIHQDAADAKAVLDVELYQSFRNDKLFRDTDAWEKRNSGLEGDGDSTACWEFDTVTRALDEALQA